MITALKSFTYVNVGINCFCDKIKRLQINEPFKYYEFGEDAGINYII